MIISDSISEQRNTYYLRNVIKKRRALLKIEPKQIFATFSSHWLRSRDAANQRKRGNLSRLSIQYIVPSSSWKCFDFRRLYRAEALNIIYFMCKSTKTISVYLVVKKNDLSLSRSISWLKPVDLILKRLRDYIFQFYGITIRIHRFKPGSAYEKSCFRKMIE